MTSVLDAKTRTVTVMFVDNSCETSLLLRAKAKYAGIYDLSCIDLMEWLCLLGSVVGSTVERSVIWNSINQTSVIQTLELQ